MVSIMRIKSTMAVQRRLDLGFPTAVERSRARHWRPSVMAAPYAMPKTNIPVKYMLSFEWAAGGSLGVQLGSYATMIRVLLDLANPLIGM
jgi:hypothetical protein